MCFYPGGKRRICNEISFAISDAVFDEMEKTGFSPKGYTEPFLGMASVYQHMPEIFQDYDLVSKGKMFSEGKFEYLAGDRNPYIVKLWKKLQTGWKPPKSCTEEEFYNYKDKKSTSAKAIFCGFSCAYRGDFRSSYFPKNNVARQAQHCMETGRKIKNVKITEGDYSQFSDCYQHIIYCDPPYYNTQNPYKIGAVKNNEFDYEKFVEWCLKMSEDNMIFISEYTQPCSEAKLILDLGKEKLFMI